MQSGNSELIQLSLSSLPRTGFKGRDANRWLLQQGVTLPDAANSVSVQTDNSLIARLSNEESLILSAHDGSSNLVTQLDSAWSLDACDGCYQLPRMHSHDWIALIGIQVPGLLAKLCGVDMRPTHFANHSVAQTSLARVNVICIRHDLEDQFCIYLLSDASFSQYLNECLLDAMQEFDGRVVEHLAQSPTHSS